MLRRDSNTPIALSKGSDDVMSTPAPLSKSIEYFEFPFERKFAFVKYFS